MKKFLSIALAFAFSSQMMAQSVVYETRDIVGLQAHEPR